MYAPTTRRTRCLFTVRTYPTREGRLYVYVAPEGIAEFFGRTSAEVTEALSGTEWLQLGPEHVAGFVAGLVRLFGTE
jgi:hypothetical protein